MLHFFSRYKNGLVFAILVSICIIFISLRSTKTPAFVNSIVQTVSYPFVFVFGEIKTEIENFFSNLSTLSETVDKLESSVEMLKEKADERQLILNLKRENTKLKHMLSFKEVLKDEGFETEIAEVIGIHERFNFTTYTVDKGLNSGIRRNMPVIAYDFVCDSNGKETYEKYAVGIISEVSGLNAKVLPVTNEDFSVVVTFTYSDYIGFYSGRGRFSSTSLVEQINYKANIYPGDEVITLGGDSYFPGGIKIGKILRVEERRDVLSKKAYVIPYMKDLPKRQLFVIKTKQKEIIENLSEEMD